MAAAEKVRNPWTELQDEDGTPFYYNSVTKESVWEKPADFYAAEILGFLQALQQLSSGTNQQPAKAVEKQSAKSAEKKSAKAVKNQSAKAAKKQPAKAEKQPAKGPEKEPATSMEVEDSEESESEFQPVVKARRRKTTETSVNGGQEVLLSSNKFSPLAEKTANNNNAIPAAGKTTSVVSPSGESAGEKNVNNNASPATGKSTPVVPASGKPAGEKKQPPLVVKNMSFASLAKVMSSCDVQPENKLTRNGTKLTCFSSEDFDTVQAHLKKHNVEFYTHGRRSERPHRVVIRGLPNLEPELIQKLLKKDHQLDALAVHAIKRKQQLPALDETPFIVLFPKGHTSLKELRSKVKKVGPVVVRWEPYRNKQPQVTQCKNCLQFGHGTSNCHLKPRCSSCGGPHSTEKCTAAETQANKCVNCSGSHEGLDRSCPKRAQFIQSRQQASKPKPPAWKKDKRSPVVPAFSAADFPPLPGAGSSEQKDQHPHPAGSEHRDTGPSAGTTPKEQVLYSSSELWAIFREFSARLKQSKTPQEQVEVVAYLVCKYGAK